MGPSREGKRWLWEGLKLVALAAVGWALLGRVDLLRREIGASRTASAASRQAYVVPGQLAPLVRAVEGSASDIGLARAHIDEALSRLETQAAAISRLEGKAARLERSVESRLEEGYSAASRTASLVDVQAERVERLESMLAREPERMKHRMLLPTVQLRGSGTVGSGVVVYSEPNLARERGDEEPYTTFVLTAYHVVLEVLGDRQDAVILDEIQAFGVETADAEEAGLFQARLILHDRTRDVALLRLNTTKRFRHVADLISTQDLRSVDVFTRTYAVGCPLGNNPLPTLGEVSSKRKVVGEQAFWMVNAPTFFGNSGGGVFLARNFQLIGISSMIYTYGKTHPTVVPHMGLFVPLDVVYQWLEGEGYGFVFRRQPIPEALRAKLAFGEAAAAPASARVDLGQVR